MTVLSNNLLRLRAIEPQDLELIYRIENDTDLWNCSDTSIPYSRFAVKRYISENTNDFFTDRQVRLVAERLSDGAPVGFADLTGFNPFHRRAEVGIVVFPAHRRRGYGVSLLDLLEHYAHEFLPLHGIFAIVAESNAPAVRLFETAGYVRKALLEDWLAKGKTFGSAWLFQKILR